MTRPRAGLSFRSACSLGSGADRPSPPIRRLRRLPPAPRLLTNDLSPSRTPLNYARAAHLLSAPGLAARWTTSPRRDAPRQAVDSPVDFDQIPRDLKPFDESGLWDSRHGSFPPSRAEAVRLRVSAARLGERRPAGFAAPSAAGGDSSSASRRTASDPRLGLWWATNAHDPAPARGEADAVLARTLRHRREQGARLPPMLRQNEMSARRRPAASPATGILKDRHARLSRQRREHQDHPNENFGRELLELFSMGVGNYTERDVREAARVHRLTNDALQFVRRRAARAGDKTFSRQN